MEWLSEYQEAMARSVLEHGGVVDDFTGDGLKADFGIPLARTTDTGIARDAANAVECALAMREEMTRLCAQWAARQLPVVTMRVGINTGPVVAGLVGTARRMKYTTIGDTVNIAARLEGFDKNGAEAASPDGLCRILIGGPTLARLGSAYAARKVGEAVLRGRSERTAIYALLGRREQPSGDRKEVET